MLFVLPKRKVKGSKHRKCSRTVERKERREKEKLKGGRTVGP